MDSDIFIYTISFGNFLFRNARLLKKKHLLEKDLFRERGLFFGPIRLWTKAVGERRQPKINGEATADSPENAADVSFQKTRNSALALSNLLYKRAHALPS